jgi:hypothetical protein
MKVVVRAIFPIYYLTFTERGASAAGEGMTYMTGLDELDKIRSVGGRSKLCWENVLWHDCGKWETG